MNHGRGSYQSRARAVNHHSPECSSGIGTILGAEGYHARMTRLARNQLANVCFRPIPAISLTGYTQRMEIDWNPVVHILDTLSEGTHSLLELSYMARHYERSAFLGSLLFLAERSLVELSADRTSLQPIPQAQWAGILRSAFETDHPDEATMVNTQIDLTKAGDQVLRLFGIGHP